MPGPDSIPSRPDTVSSAFELCATAMATVDASLVIRSINQGLRDWLGAAARNWIGAAIAVLDAKPPQLVQAASHALREDRRVWLRGARVRTAIGDRDADLALTPLDARTLLLEVHATAGAQAGTRLSESLRGFAHEVKGPLAGIRGAAQLLQRRVDAPDRLGLADLIIAEADRLAALSDRLLHVGAQARLLPVNVHEVVERVAALISAEPMSPHIQRDYDPSLPPVAADADRLQQALLNLARNAAEAGAHRLTLRSRAEQGTRVGRGAQFAVRLDVVDDGRGVPAEVAETLFEPLVSGRADGTGLGLAIAREIAHEHAGELSYVSRPGTTVFTLLLPLAE